jgi:hypothetical protein
LARSRREESEGYSALDAEELAMLTDRRYWTLRFDGYGFQLDRGSSPQPSAKHRVIEENLETILFLWGNALLVAPNLQMLGYSGAVAREQDLLAVDELGRIHIFELKKVTADAKAMFQLVSYLTGRPRDDELWVRQTITNTLWHGEQAIACRLAGLVARRSGEKLRTAKSRRVVGGPVPYGELLEARLKRLTALAAARTGLGLFSEEFEEISGSLLEQGFGRTWSGPLDAPGELLDEVANSRMPRQWELGRTKPGIVIWMVAPNVVGALRAAQPLIERGLEIRCVSMDVREVDPGREWSIAIAEPLDQVKNWMTADAFGRLLVEIGTQHLQECPGAATRLHLGIEPATVAWAQGKGWAELGWRAAGGASIEYSVRNDRIEWELYNHWWTHGQALKTRAPLLRLCASLRKKHPRAWSWAADDAEHESTRQFVEGAVALSNAFYRGLVEIGAFEVDPWAYWMPPNASSVP